MSDDFFGAEIPAVDSMPSFELIPAGDYKAILLEGNKEDKEHRDGGAIREIVFKFQIIEGKYQNRFIWQRYSTIHPSDKAQNFARNMIGSFAKAVGEEVARSPADLVNKPVGIKLKVDPERTFNGNTYAARNQIAGYMSVEAVDGAPAPKPAPTPAPKKEEPKEERELETADAGDGKKKMPWE